MFLTIFLFSHDHNFETNESKTVINLIPTKHWSTSKPKRTKPKARVDVEFEQLGSILDY